MAPRRASGPTAGTSGATPTSEAPINEVARAGFTAAAEAYERGRPSYPDEAVRLLVDELGIGPGRDVLDLAAGTGKLTRILATTGASVVAVEPVEAMRSLLTGVAVLDGTAEAIPLSDASVDVVTVAQAFHWFDPPAALAEIDRVLRPGGALGLIWNERDESVPWVTELGRIFDWQVQRPYDKNVDWAGVLDASGRFGPAFHRQLGWEQELDEDGLVDRVLSTSYVATWDADRQDDIARQVRSLVAGFPAVIRLPYVTDVFWCSKTS
jgi:SAM-dependent methyltransferase